LKTTEYSDVKVSKAFNRGIYFSCQMCGECCRGFEEGEVYLYLDDIEHLIKFLNLKGKNKKRRFAKKYLKIIDDSFKWKKPGSQKAVIYKYKTLGFKFTGDDEHCEFLDENNCCIVHEARPFQCRCFPFWKMMVSNKKTISQYSKKCVGLKASLNKQGKFYSYEEILKWAQKEYDIEKEYFLKMKENDFDIRLVYPFLPKDMG